jgi:hypothetical protein
MKMIGSAYGNRSDLHGRTPIAVFVYQPFDFAEEVAAHHSSQLIHWFFPGVSCCGRFRGYEPG